MKMIPAQQNTGQQRLASLSNGNIGNLMPSLTGKDIFTPGANRHSALTGGRRRLRHALLVMATVLLAACSERPGTEVLYPRPDAAENPDIVTVFVATTRGRAENAADGFTNLRAGQMSYAEFRISVPPGHRPGEIEWPKGRVADPQTDFTVVSHTILDATSFEQRVAARTSSAKGEGAAVFVHGFNTSFQEGLFRTAQMTADANLTGAPILFSWPSDAQVLGYATDKEAATYSRDGLTGLLARLTRLPEVDRVSVMGHSMGGWLTAESLRQLRLSGQDGVLRELDVVLAAPDIDADVFRAQASVIGPMDPPMVVLVSPDDRALQVSRMIQGARQRVGALDVNNPVVQQGALQANIMLVDISTIETSDDMRHSRYAGLAALYPRLSDEAGDVGGFRSAGALVFNAVGATLAAPFNVAGGILAE
ncbi:alpha/beta hydrolase [Paracoccus versutus]|nr:alpha/beta fold hydrolase [Paracoccus versutus]